jgi:hypothetical protein
MQAQNHHNTNSPISASTIYQSLNKKRFATSVSHSPTTAPSTQTSNKPSRNRANLLYHIRGRIHGCHSKPLNHTHKTFIRPIVDYRAPIYASLPQKTLNQIAACERKIIHRIFRLPDRHFSNLVHADTNTTRIQDRLITLQKRYIDRTLNSLNEIAIQTLHTSHKFQTLDGTLLNRVPRVPRRKQKYPCAHTT